MNAFVDTVKNYTETENGMPAYKSTTNALLDLFSVIASSRGNDYTKEFDAALEEDFETTIKILAWARDIRGGAGERETFRKLAKYIEKRQSLNKLFIIGFIRMIPEIGRWDDLLIFETKTFQEEAFAVIGSALANKNQLCAKWMPRQGKMAAKLRKFFKMSPKQWRKMLVELTNVVETKMCANEWDDIDFEKVPSLAISRYRSAFARHTENFAEYSEKLSKGEAKVNTDAVFPYDVLKNIYDSLDDDEMKFIVSQWNAMPDFSNGKNILPMIDVSGSMLDEVSRNLSAMDVAISMGLYFSEKQTGVFKDTYLTFETNPKICHCEGNIQDKYASIKCAVWGGSTNISKAFDKILNIAVNGSVPQSDMPEYLIIFSDMQFDQCTDKPNERVLEIFRGKFQDKGYTVPKLIFWNICGVGSRRNFPTMTNENGVTLVSGFSPSVVRNLFSMEDFDPMESMYEIIDVSRYDYKKYLMRMDF